jgi:hypothetical protein
MKMRACLVAGAVAVSFGVASAEEPTKPKPGPEHKKLEYFVGSWTSEGDMKASPFGPGGKISNADECKLFEGGFAVVCHSKGEGPMGPSKGIGILGYSIEEKAYTYYGVDNSGMIMGSIPKGHVDGDNWTYTGEDKIQGKTIHSRYSIKIVSPTNYTFKWEMQGEGSWTTLLEGKTTRKAAK